MIGFSRILASALLIICFYTLSAQTNISGIINIYAEVTAIDSCANQVTVASNPGFSVGDTVVLIQMQGATIDATNSANFGNVTSLGSAGNYEYLVISNIAGNVFTFQYQMLRSYDPAGSVQLVNVPQYVNANINGSLTASTWNGTTGGVLAFDVSGTLTFSSDINLNNLGFRGGAYINQSTPTCGCAFGGDPEFPDYYYASSLNMRGSSKGEGIAAYVVNREYGKGKQANGGGGGNDHNSGGAGAGNFGAGGNGGTRISIPSCFFGQYCRGNHPGVAGLGLTYSTAQNRVFLGGGGGSGHGNNSVGTSGGNGGGILLLRAGTIAGNNRNIFARGQSVTALAQGDGSGGGGAGGAVLIQATNFGGTNLNVSVAGGNGGNNSWGSGGNNCMGTGGGGGGGVVWVSAAAVPANVLATVSGGANGTQTGTDCSGQNGGAQPGANGGTLTNLAMVQSSVVPNNCALPADFVTFSGEAKNGTVNLYWSAVNEASGDVYHIQRADRNGSFFSIATETAHFYPSNIASYTYTDHHPAEGLNLYRIHRIDKNGNGRYSSVIQVFNGDAEQFSSYIYPSPIKAGQDLHLIVDVREAEEIQCEVFDLAGRSVKKLSSEPAGEILVNTEGLSPGFYLLRVSEKGRSVTHKFQVLHR